MSNPKKPTQRPQKGRARPANKPSGSGETGPAPEVRSGCHDSSSQEEPNTGPLPYLDLLLECERHVIDAVNDKRKLKDAIVSFRSHLPGLLRRLWELQTEQQAIMDYLIDSSMDVMKVCEKSPGLPATYVANKVTHEVAREVFLKLALLANHQRKDQSELEEVINSVMKGHYPMSPD